MKKIKFVPDCFNLKKLAEYLQLSLIIVGSTQLSPNVIKYWERYRSIYTIRHDDRYDPSE